MIFRRTTALFAAASLAAALRAQEAPPPPAAVSSAPVELTLQECVSRALQRNFDLEAQRYNPLIARESIAIARSPYLPIVTADASKSVARTSPSGSTPGTRTEYNRVRAGVSETFYTGTTVAVGANLDSSRINPAVTSLNPAYDADLTLSVRQDLLQGFGIGANRANVDVARLDLQRADLDYKAVALDIVQATENAYYNLVFARGQLAVRQFTLALSEKLFGEAKTRRDTGVATDLDVLTGEVGVANSRRGVILAQQAVKDAEERLLSLIGQFELEKQVGSVAFPQLDGTLPVYASSYNLALHNEPDYLSAQAAIEQAKLNLKIAKNNAKPALSVGGAVGLSGTNGSRGSAIDDAFTPEDQSWQVDVSLTYPWGQVAGRARARQAQSRLSQQETLLRRVEQNIEVQVRAAVRSVETNIEAVKIAAQSRELSDRQYELERARFDAGLSTSYRVLQAQDDLENARVAELQSETQLRTAIATLHRLEGSSLQRYNLPLPQQ